MDARFAALVVVPLVACAGPAARRASAAAAPRSAHPHLRGCPQPEAVSCPEPDPFDEATWGPPESFPDRNATRRAVQELRTRARPCFAATESRELAVDVHVTVGESGQVLHAHVVEGVDHALACCIERVARRSCFPRFHRPYRNYTVCVSARLGGLLHFGTGL